MTLTRNTAWNLLGVLVPLAAAVWAIPILMQGFGLARFGALALVWALIGYLALFELGLGRTMTVKLAPMPAGGERSGLVRCGLLLGSGAGAAGAVLTLIAAPLLARSWLQVPVELQAEVTRAFAWAALGVLPTVGTGVARGVMEASERFAMSNALRLALGLAGFVLPLWVLRSTGADLEQAVMAMVLARFACWAVALWAIRGDVFASGNAPSESLLQRAKALLRFGGWLTVSSVVGPVMVYGDRFFIGAAVGLAEVSRYSVVQELVQRLLVFPTAFTQAWLPRMACADAAAQAQAAKSGHAKFVLTMLMLCGAAAASLPMGLTWWLGAAQAALMQPMGWILCVGVAFNALSQWPFTALHARGDVRATALFHLAQLPFYLACVLWLTREFGLAGAAWAWTLRAALDWLGMTYLLRKNLTKGPR